jgi:large subunit ribosomal protein L13
MSKIPRFERGNHITGATGQKTPLPKKVQGDWYVIDATNQRLGRLASEIALILRGKNKPIYTPHLDTGDFVIVINAEKVAVTGKKREQKMYRRNSGRPGGMKVESFDKLQKRLPERIIEQAVKGMLPKNSLGRKLFTKLKVYQGAEHPHQAQKPKLLAIDTIPYRRLPDPNWQDQEDSFLAEFSQATVIPHRTYPKPKLQAKTRTMAVIREKEESGYIKLTLHSKLPDVVGLSNKTISIQPVINESLSNEEISRRYLQEVTKYRLSGNLYEWKSFDTGEIEFTKTWIAKFQQYYRDIPIYGTLASVEIDQDKNLVMMSLTSGQIPLNLKKPRSLLSSQQLENLVKSAAGWQESDHLSIESHLYWYYNLGCDRWQLVHIIEGILSITNEADEEEMPEVFDYVIDATKGEIIDAIPRIQ